MYTHTYIYIYTHTHTHMHMYIYIYIYIYIYTVKSIWPHSKIFISHPKSVIFNKRSKAPQWFYSLFKKQDFLHHIKYKSSQKTLKLLKLLIHGCYYCLKNSRHSFHQRLEVNRRLFCLAFLQELPEVSCTCGLFSSDFTVKFISHQFNGI